MTYVTLNNVEINMSTKTISGDSPDVAPLMPGTTYIFDCTDADMCLTRMWDPEQFANDLLDYAQIIIMHTPGKYYYEMPTSGVPIGNWLSGVLNDALYNWAERLVMMRFSEHPNSIIQSVTLYPGGSFKITCRTYLY